MDIYLVGGAVRDQLLGLDVQERDYVVVGSTPEEMMAQGFIAVGKDFPVFLHPDTKEEYALARTEAKISKGYKGFVFHTHPDISLEEDLSRRDLTINAMAQTADGVIIDPYGGQRDLAQRILRHVSQAFVEDPVRVLRLARFCAQFKHLGFRIAPETAALATALRRAGELDALVAERVWQEAQKALACLHPEEFFIMLKQCGGLAVLFPEIEALFGVPSEISPQHYMDSGHHALLSLSNASAHFDAPEIRFAALCHGLGKACLPPQTWPQLHGYIDASMAPLQRLCDRYKVSQEYRDIAVLTAKYHQDIQRAPSMPAAAILALLAATDSVRRPQRFLLTVQASEACLTDQTRPLHLIDFFKPLIDAVKAVKAPCRDMTDSVPSIKEAMYKARLQAIEQALASRQS